MLVSIGMALICGCGPNDSLPPKATVAPAGKAQEHREAATEAEPPNESRVEESSTSPTDNTAKATPKQPPAAQTDPPKVDADRLAAAGIRTITGKHLTLFTDLAADQAIDGLPAVFDLAVPQWCDYFHVDRSDAARWQARGYLMKAAAPFKAAGLLPDDLPQFANGYTRGNEFWCFEQPVDYYRRHLMLHEGTHAFLFCRFGTCGPPWYMEATAELLGTHRLEANRLTLGVFPTDRTELSRWGRIEFVLDAVRSGRILTIDDILGYGPDAHLDNEAYGWCWAIGAFLDGHPRYRDRFCSLVEKIKADDFDREFRAMYAADRDQLDLEWQAFVHELAFGYDLVRNAIEFRVAGPLANGKQSVTIAADRGWQSSGLRLSADHEYSIAATGRYQVADQPKPWWCEPNGVTIRYHAGRPLGMLLGIVVADDREWPTAAGIGSSGTLSPEKSGTLYLRINDSPAELADNAGTLTVTVEAR